MMFWMTALALAGDRPDRVELNPNGVLVMGDPLRVRVPGVPANSTVQVQVLRDCNGDGRPEVKDLGGCHSPIWTESLTAGDTGVAETTLQTKGMPIGVALVVRGRTEAGLADAHFWLMKEAEPASKVEEFRELLNYLWHQGDPPRLKDREWELHRYDSMAKSDAVVPGGERVTGFALDRKGVVVTRQTGEGAELVRLTKDKAEVLYSQAEGGLRAPAVAANGQVFVVATTTAGAELGRVQNQALTATVPLETAPDSLRVTGKEVFGMDYGRLGIEVYGIDRKTGARSDVADVAAALEQDWTVRDVRIVNYEDTSGQYGMDIALLQDGVPTLIPDPVGDEVLPQIGEDGAVYYLAEVKP